MTGAGITNPLLGSLNNHSGVAFIQLLIPALVSLILVAGTIIFFFMLITGAVQWITSGGDKNAVEAARGKITQALIGIIILFSVFAIVKLIETFFSINILTLDIGPLKIQ